MSFLLPLPPAPRQGLLSLPVLALVTVSILALAASAVAQENAQATAEASTPPTAPTPVPRLQPEAVRSETLADSIRRTAPQTQVVWLEAGADRFLALYHPDHSGRTFANALILHDNLRHPDWPGAVRSLRQGLAAHGWNTLSIAVPDYNPPPPDVALARAAADLSPDAADADAGTTDPDTTATATPEPAGEDRSKEIPDQLQQRVKTATGYMTQQAPLPLAIIAVGTSATILAKQAQTLLRSNIDGLVMIDPAPLPQLEGFNEALDAMDLRIPVLDLAPEFYPRSDPVLRRQNARRLGHDQYRQRLLKGFRRGLDGAEPLLQKTIRGWGKQQFGES
ncbi:MAG: DUF3530 family protein [Pseudomonadota bacterium]|nr:DUF3530 family protein [Pseudomonadota bacterium]